MGDEKKWVIDVKEADLGYSLNVRETGEVPAEVQKQILESVRSAVIATLKDAKLLGGATAALASEDPPEPVKMHVRKLT